MNDAVSELRPRDLPDWLLSQGQHWVTTGEIAALLDVPQNQVPTITARWRAKGWAFSPTRGAYVLIPSEYRAWKSVPGSHFIDPMMRFLGHDYYVSHLSAAEVHGAAHQRPQVFQVMTTGRLRSRSFGRTRLDFMTSSDTNQRAATERNTPTGTMLVSTPEVTVLDLIAAPDRGGGLSNIATVIAELLDSPGLCARALADEAGRYPRAIRQRTGWMLDFVCALVDRPFELEPMAATVVGAERTPLSTSESHHGRTDERWKVTVNTPIEPDL